MQELVRRKIIEINEGKCNGCGRCVIACAEGAIEIIHGKAKVVSDVLCDGLGACIENCPEGALYIIEREAKPFDEKSVKHRHESMKRTPCPGSTPLTISPEEMRFCADRQGAQLSNWPIQLDLAHPDALYFKNTRLLLAADCSAFAYAAMHPDFIQGRATIIYCPKLSDVENGASKLSQILAHNDIKDVKVVRMKVPCCGGLITIVKKAVERSGKNVPLDEVVIDIDGTLIKGNAN
ncbi:MAG: 4Fe-4S binding protein [Methanomassiliicoccales archaeon]